MDQTSRCGCMMTESILIEAWGRGFEIITEVFSKEGLSVPTFKEEFGGVTAVIKREIFQAVQQGKSSADGNRDLRDLVSKGWIVRIGSDRGGWWKVIKKL